MWVGTRWYQQQALHTQHIENHIGRQLLTLAFIHSPFFPPQVVPTALRGAFQSCGQNCAGAERFIVQDAVYDDFVARVTAATAGLRQGPALGGAMIDCGALCMPGLDEKVHSLVQDAVSKGAKARGLFEQASCHTCL